MYQVYDDKETTTFFAKFVKIHMALKEYKMNLMKVAETEGIPPLRPLLMEFPKDHKARPIRDQFMLGEDLMMAPILLEYQTEREVYLPAGKWVHYFTHEVQDMTEGGQSIMVQSPIG